MTIDVFAPAKINLTLHVTGQRPDGYHLLDSLVVFVDVGDRISMSQDDGLSLEANGPYAGNLDTGGDNLILRAARMMAGDRGAKITLEKNLPVSSGIGGGSSDAAATLRGLSTLWRSPIPENPESLGADVPVCLRAMPTRMQGVGEVLGDVPTLPQVWLVLVNPGVSVSTPKVFSVLKSKDNRPMPEELTEWASPRALAAWLRRMRNDLEAPAVILEPVIATCIAALRTQKGCLMARMSGSGATCWGLFETQEAARHAADTIAEERPGWWVKTAEVTPV